jgi:hypothetical protein
MDDRLKTDIQRLAYQRPSKVALSGATAPAPILEKTALGQNSAGTASAGIASPLVEQDYAERTWHAAYDLTTTDGVFTFAVEDLAAIQLADANGQPVVIQFAAAP